MDDYEFFHCVPFVPGVEFFRAAITRRIFPVHAHEGFVVSVVHEGIQELTHFGKVYRVCAGSVVFLNPEELHAVRAADPCGVVYQTLHVPASLFYAAAGDTFRFRRPVEYVPELSRRLACSINGVRAALNPQQAHTILSELVGEVMEFQESLFPQPNQLCVGGMRHLFEYIEQNFATSLSVGALARRIEVTPQHLIRVFKQATGVTPHAYIQARRIALAKQLLHTSAPIDVAMAVGFADQSHLTRWMKACYGITPAMYRKTVERLDA